jgi:hypothetical protein
MFLEIMISTANEGVQNDELRVGDIRTEVIAQRFHIPEYQDHPDAYTDYADLVEGSGRSQRVSPESHPRGGRHNGTGSRRVRPL